MSIVFEWGLFTICFCELYLVYSTIEGHGFVGLCRGALLFEWLFYYRLYVYSPKYVACKKLHQMNPSIVVYD